MGLLSFTWDGEVLRPSTTYLAKKAAEQFAPGERVQLEQVFERSDASHKQYFASVHDAWLNLPEQYRLEYPTSEHLRAKALCLKGWHTRQDFVCKSAPEARRLAAAIHLLDEYAVVTIDGNLVTLLRAKSQAYNKMRKADFERSKRDVLEYAWGLSGIDAETGELHGGKAA